MLNGTGHVECFKSLVLIPSHFLSGDLVNANPWYQAIVLTNPYGLTCIHTSLGNMIDTLRLRLNGHHFANDVLKLIFLYENLD